MLLLSAAISGWVEDSSSRRSFSGWKRFLFSFHIDHHWKRRLRKVGSGEWQHILQRYIGNLFISFSWYLLQMPFQFHWLQAIIWLQNFVTHDTLWFINTIMSHICESKGQIGIAIFAPFAFTSKHWSWGRPFEINNFHTRFAFTIFGFILCIFTMSFVFSDRTTAQPCTERHFRNKVDTSTNGFFCHKFHVTNYQLSMYDALQRAKMTRKQTKLRLLRNVGDYRIKCIHQPPAASSQFYTHIFEPDNAILIAM